MAFEKINADDTLNQGRIKINNNGEAVKGQISQLSESITKISDDVKNLIGSSYLDKNALVNTGYYVQSSGVLTGNGTMANFNATDYIDLKDVSKVIINTALIDAAVIAIFNADKEVTRYIPDAKFDGVSGKFGQYSIEIAENERYIVSSCWVGKGSINEFYLKRTLNINGLQTDISGLQTDISGLQTDISIDEVDYLHGYINYSNGNLERYELFRCTDFIDISKAINGSLILITCEVIDSHGVAFYDADKEYISGYSENDIPRGIVSDYAFEIPKRAKYVRFGFRTDKAPKTAHVKFLYVAELQNDVAELQNDVAELQGGKEINISESIEYIDGWYIHKDGIIKELASYSYSELIELRKGERLVVTAIVISPGNVSMLSKWSKDGSKFLENLHTSSMTTAETEDYTATDEIEYLRICYHKNGGTRPIPTVLKTELDFSEVKKIIFENQEEKIAINQKLEVVPMDNFWSYAMWRVLCIGDSLTSGANYKEEWGELAPTGASIDENIPRILGRMLCAEVDNGGFSGYSASTWYTKQQDGTINDNHPYDFSKYDTFIIWLGTNNGFTDTLDVDVNPYSDYHNYANTETGYYCKLIEDIKAHNNDCLIVLVKVFASKGDWRVSNTVIDKIAEKYNLPVIDNSDLGPSEHIELHAGITNPHFGKAGNIYIANRYISELGKYFAENPLRCEYGYTERTN